MERRKHFQDIVNNFHMVKIIDKNMAQQSGYKRNRNRHYN